MTPKKTEKRCSEKNSNLIFILATFVAVLAAALAACLLNQNSIAEIEVELPKSEKIAENVEQLRYWSVSISNWNQLGNLRSMDRTFEALQYKFVNASNGDDWDILWAKEYPFEPVDEQNALFARFEPKNLRHDQKVNHIPGIGILISKSEMNENNQHLKYILPSFVLPYDKERLKDFIAANPNVQLVEKSVYNRGVGIIKPRKINFDYSDYFYQQFLDKPFLIDGHAFDVGIFVLITSVDPIRVYRFDADILFRFCKEKYHPFDAKNFDKYVVQEGCHPIYDMPTFRDIYGSYQYPFRRMFEHHVSQKGFDVDKLWTQIDDAIVQTVLNTESRVLDRIKKFNTSTHHFFELVRYDFLFDENLQPFVMEVNMSPNLTPATKRYKDNGIIYEQLIMNVVQMIGFGSHFEFQSRFNDTDIATANSKNIAVDIKHCLNHDCHQNCHRSRCRVCQPCLSPASRFQLREAFREHSHAANFHRLFPRSSFYDNDDIFESMTDNNKISMQWFDAKCREDVNWC